MAYALNQLPRIKAQPKGDNEKHQRVDNHAKPCVCTLWKIGRNRHFKGNGGGTGYAQAGAY